MLQKFNFNKHPIQKKSSYIKELYLTIISVVIQFENKISQEQYELLTQLKKGIGIDEETELYLKRGLILSEDLLSEAEQYLSEEPAAFFLIVDSLVISNVNISDLQAISQLLRDMVLIFKVKPEVFDYLVLLAKMISESNYQAYAEIVLKRPRNVCAQMFSYYFSQSDMDKIDELDYKWLIKSIIENKQDYSYIHYAFLEVAQKYLNYFNSNYLEDFRKYKSQAPLAIFVLLMNEKLRKKYINNSDIRSQIDLIYQNNPQLLEKYIVRHNTELFNYIRRGHLFDKVIIEPYEVKCLLLYLNPGTEKLSYGKFSSNLGGIDGISDREGTKIFNADEVNGKFLLLNGLLCHAGAPAVPPEIIYIVEPEEVKSLNK